MSKIVTAVNAMISHNELITDVIRGSYEKEYFFRYSKKHHWSIYEGNVGGEKNQYYLNYYPGNPDLTELAALPDQAWHDQGPKLVSYNTKDLATKEALDSFRELYSIVSEKAFGMDDILDEIIGNDLFK